MTAPIAQDARIVVGVDGSAQSKVALRWARHLAELYRAGVDVVMAWEYPTNLGWSILPSAWNPQDDAHQALLDIVEDVWGSNQPAGLRLVVKEGNAARRLLDESKGATMLVVGSRGHGGFAGLLLGSVSASCAAHATCPVLVVHGDRPPAAG
jgi:nucleotide-binding universal stress UspA family protein